MGPLGARKVLCSSVCVLVHACVRVSVCVCAVAEGDLRGPASYSLSAGDHHFHKTSIVGTELQTPETHWKQLQCTHTHTHTHTHIHTNTHTQKYIHTEDKTVWRDPSRDHVLLAMNKITVSPSKESHRVSHTHTHTHTHFTKCGSSSLTIALGWLDRLLL